VLREWVDFSPVFTALKDLKDVKMVIVGKEGYYEENKKLAKEHGVEDQVTFVGMVPYKDVTKIRIRHGCMHDPIQGLRYIKKTRSRSNYSNTWHAKNP